ncbi:MAG: exodeoxyribonuclease VII large subunit [Planctomycetes bacterium]|nr:exodeoxyribonuclease VII large subunit [Planctomycetota bacterium]
MADRPLFDPTRVRAPVEGRPPQSIVTPRQVNELVRGAINRHIPATLHVAGEIGDLSRPGSGHLYFTLKDEASELRCGMWRNAAAALKFQLQPGLGVIATGGIDVYTPRGTYQLVVRKLEPRGVGSLELAFRQLKEKLEREGLFATARKRPLPAFPRRIAVVTSPGGAALRDMIHTIQRRFPAVELLLFPTRVQGEGAAAEVATAIETLNAHAQALGGIDVAIVGRGGGSLEDLWPFNEEVVARAIFASRVPIVSAVGHETDVSISDMVADVRAATPTAAAELVTPRLADLQTELLRLRERGTRVIAIAFEHARLRLARAGSSSSLGQPFRRTREQSQRLDERVQRLARRIAERMRVAHTRLTQSELAVLRFGSGATFARIGRDLDRRVGTLREYLARLLQTRQRALSASRTCIAGHSPLDRATSANQRLAELRDRVAGAWARHLELNRERLDSRLRRLEAASPRSVLTRGFTITRRLKGGVVLRSAADLHEGDRIEIEFADGKARATSDDPRQPRLFEP